MIDELAALNFVLVRRAIAPIARVSHCSIMAMSTFGEGRANNFTRIMKLTYFRRRVFQSICDQCKLKNKKLKGRCVHNPEGPRWFSEERDEEIKMLMGDDEEAINRELYTNLEDEQDFSCFPKEQVLEAFVRPHLPVPNRRAVYVFIDPAVGTDGPRESQKSFYTLMASIAPGMVVTMASMNANVMGEVDDVVIRCLQGVRKIRTLEQCLFFFAVEHGTGMEPIRLKEAILRSKIEGVVFMSDFVVSEGVRMTHEKKQTMVDLTYDAFMHEHICFAKEFFCLTDEPDKIKARLKDELLRYEYKIREPEGDDAEFKKKKVIMSGKGESGQLRDDLATCLCWSQAMYVESMDEKYAQFFGGKRKRPLQEIAGNRRKRALLN